jgi:hypothetical protein
MITVAPTARTKTNQRPEGRWRERQRDVAIVAALEALGDGDSRLAAEFLLAALEDGFYVVRARCRACGATYEWAGLRDAYELAVNGFGAEAAA